MGLFDIHIHSLYSDGADSVQDIVKEAKKIGLSGIAITDHNEIKGAIESKKLYNESDFHIIVGLEVSTLDGHILCLGVGELIEKGLSADETIQKAHLLGGIAIAVHPYDTLRGGVGDLIKELPFDAIEVENGHTIHSYKDALHSAREVNGVIVGGSDAHCLEEVGTIMIRIPDDYNEKPLDAIKEGKVEEVICKRSKIRILKNYLKAKIKKKGR